MEILLLCDHRRDGAATVLEHIDALERHTRHRVRMLSMLGDLPERLDLERFDAVIVHYSLILSNDNYVSASARERLRRYAGLKVVFIQDEYRWVERTIAALNYVGADLLFTCVPTAEIDQVYPPAATPSLRKVNTLTGYVPEQLLWIEPLPYEARPVDVGYRARKLSALFGQLAREKWQIADRFSGEAAAFGLKCDISCREADRLYGQRWIEFVRSCKAMLGSESGASVFDFSGALQPAIEAFERSHPEATFEDIQARFFPGQDGLIRMNQISPRCFEAAALRTLMILYEGEYSGVLEPWRHYVPLKKDHSNVGEVVSALRNPTTWATIVEAAYREVACNPDWSYQRFAAGVGRVLSEQWAVKERTPAVPYSDREFARATARYTALLKTRRTVHSAALALVERLPRPLFLALRYIWRSVRYATRAATARRSVRGTALAVVEARPQPLFRALRCVWRSFRQARQARQARRAGATRAKRAV